MTDYLIVDGYNVIGSWPELKGLRQKAMASAREQLIEMLAEYRAYTGQHVIVVFDAYRSKGRASQEIFPGLEIVFSKKGQTADSLIEALVSDLSGRHQIAVVTSDWAQQQIVLGKGARRWSSQEFRGEVVRIRGLISTSANRTRRERGTTNFATRLSANARRQLEVLGRGEDKP